MGARRVLLLGAAETDVGLAVDQDGAVRPLGGGQGAVDVFRVVSIAGNHLPARGGETRALVGHVRHGNRPVDGDVVVVPKDDQLAQLLHSGQADRLLADAFHQAAVTGDHPGVMVHDLGAEARAQAFFGHRETDRVRNSLTKRPRRRLHARDMAVFRVAGRDCAPLAEVPDLVQRHILVAGEVQERIDQHRSMARRQDEPVAVGPAGGGSVELEMLFEKHGRHVGHTHRHARMAGIRGLNRIHGERADCAGLHPVVGVFIAKRGNVQGPGPSCACGCRPLDSSHPGKIKRSA